MSRPPRAARHPRARAATTATAGVALALPLALPLAVALAATGLAAPAPAAATPAASTAPPTIGGPYRPPVDAPVIDPFRPPLHPFGPGNRGLTYGVAPLTPVRAAGAGVVVFAGPVARTLHVTIAHPDGLRTSYSYLASLAVTEGAAVELGAVIGWSTDVLHLGVRTPDGTYLDPGLLWSGGPVPVLVPGGDDGAPVPSEVPILAQLVRERAGPLAAWWATAGLGAGSFDRRLALWWHLARELDPATHRARLVDAVGTWLRSRSDCTPPDRTPPPPAERRILVEVAGVGSTSDAAAIADLDAAALGYDGGDVIRFSYAGGRVPGPPGEPAGWATGLPTTTYDAGDSQADLDRSAGRLAALLGAVAAANPGVPIDVVAHSQGGVVARLAVDGAWHDGRLPAEVRHVVTLGSPHQGADLATVLEAVGDDPEAAALIEQARQAWGLELDPGLPSLGQLSAVSPQIARLADAAPPPGVRLTSIAARGDLVVPAPRTDAPGAAHATVGLVGVDAHDHLPGSPEATREVLLAVADHPPTCRSLPDALVDLALGDGIALVEDAVGAASAGAVLVGTR